MTSGSEDDTTQWTFDTTQAMDFYIDSNSYLIEAEGNGVGLIGNESPSPIEPIVYWDYSDTISESNGQFVPINCTFAYANDGTCPMTCVGSGGSTVNNYCNGPDGFWYLGDPADAPCSNVFRTFVVFSAPASS